MHHDGMSQRHRVFARMWGVAALAHLAGNWRYGDIAPEPTLIGFVLLAVGLLGTWLVITPRRATLVALCVAVPVSAVLEAPVLGNHWLLAAFVSVGYLVVGADWDRFEPVARMILLVFYAFAAFAKLNTGFLDPATSCGLVYTNQWLDGFGLGSIPAASLLGWTSAWGAALVELAIPVLLMVPGTRAWGALAGMAFHGLISLDLNQHFFDFTAVLLPLFALFLSDAFFECFEKQGERLRPRLRRVLMVVVGLIGLAVTAANVTPLVGLTAWFLDTGSFLWWVPYLAVVAWAASGARRSVAVSWRMGPVAIGLVVLAVLNGLTPYLELKTAYGWNMYSNLVTVDGESNHLIVRSTLPLREGHQALITVIESSDPGLQVYADQGYLLPAPSFLSYLAEHPDISVTFERLGVVHEVPRVADSVYSEGGAWWWRWLPLRAVHGDQPDRCQTVFLPAL